MVRTPDHEPRRVNELAETKNILRLFERTESEGHRDVFADWIALMLCALNSPHREEEYLRLTQPYVKRRNEGQRPIDHLCEAFALLQISMQKTNQDVLGTLYELYAASSKSRQRVLGQFFTPIPIANMMAELVGDTLNEPQTICDPCSGSGRLLVASARHNHPDSVFVGIDRDPLCADMTALNLLFFNMSGIVLWGNSLSNEFHAGYQTRRTYLGGVLQKMSDAEVEQTTKWLTGQLATTQTAPDTNQLVQMRMFDEW